MFPESRLVISCNYLFRLFLYSCAWTRLRTARPRFSLMSILCQPLITPSVTRKCVSNSITVPFLPSLALQLCVILPEFFSQPLLTPALNGFTVKVTGLLERLSSADGRFHFTVLLVLSSHISLIMTN
jgi:hypothetical protein